MRSAVERYAQTVERYGSAVLFLTVDSRAADRPKPVTDAPSTWREGRFVPVEPVLLPVEEAARALGIGRSEAFKLIREGKLRSVRLGRRRLVPTSAVDEFAEEVIREED